MKCLPLSLICGAMLAAHSNAAVILDCKVWVDHTRSYFSDYWYTAEYLVANGDKIDWRYHEIARAEMTIDLEAGETVSKAWVDLSNGERADPLWMITSFSSNTLTSWFDNAQPFPNGERTAPLYFHLETNLGTFSKQYAIIPEPSAACLLGAGVLAVGLRRRR
jgi:hypothetical protein